MNSISKNARIAGFIYLLLVIAGPLRLLYIPNTLFVSGDASATASNIAAHEMLFRMGMVSDLFCGVIGIFLVLALFRLFKGVDQKWTLLMIMLGGVMPAANYCFIVLNDCASLILVHGADFLSAFDKPQRDALAMLFLRMHSQAILIAMVFWGLWLFPLSVLIWKSRYLPRFLAVWLVINGVAYLAQSLTGLLVPQFDDLVANIAFPAQFGEVAFMLWILTMGSKDRTANAQVPTPA
jgi:hypothetical protein